MVTYVIFSIVGYTLGYIGYIIMLLSPVLLGRQAAIDVLCQSCFSAGLPTISLLLMSLSDTKKCLPENGKKCQLASWQPCYTEPNANERLTNDVIDRPVVFF